MTHSVGDYSLLLVFGSWLVAVAGASVGLFSSQYVRDSDGRVRVAWTMFSSLVIAGCMMWSAHYVGMLAYQPDWPITFDVHMTWLSFVMPVVFAAVAVLIVTRHPESLAVLTVGGATMTMGLVALHYAGVAAMRTPAHITHDATLVAVSIVLAFVTSTGALFVMVKVQGWHRYLAVPLMGLAVCSMHYTGMAAMEPVRRSGSIEYFEGALTHGMLTTWVVSATGAVIMLGVLLGLAGYLDRASTHSRRQGSL
ncbi:MHYT domain-containing protein [Halofilum ochraceum]|uniref:MHYT domain-containing protein n=1 Tax=Halofilum ochraceum TaxID=1611323 RepID=UPI000831C7F0|nr:MHYT domain-containing protein [Halofilum ochraceum]